MKRFVSEPIAPVEGSSDIAAMARGEPGVPRAFVWRNKKYEIARVESAGKGMREDRGDVYVSRHRYTIVTTTGERMEIYFERNPKGRLAASRRWWLYTVEEPKV